MNSNYRRQTSSGQFAAVIRWVIVVAFFCVVGLSYVYLKYQMGVGGLQKHALEKRLSELISQNNALETQIIQLKSPTTLQRRLDDGFLKLVAINPQAVIRVRTADFTRRVAEDSRISDFHPVSHELSARR